jgi:trimeric autotransporter adhesin
LLAPSTIAGVSTSTVTSGDSVVGGAGNDTLTINVSATANTSLTGLTVSGVENIVIVGSDNLATGTSSGAATVASTLVTKTAADATLANALQAAGVAAQISNAYAWLAANVTDTLNSSTDTTAGIGSMTDTAFAALSGVNSGFTKAQLQAANTAIKSSATGITIISDLTTDQTALRARATDLKANADTAVTNAGTAVTAAQVAAFAAAAAYTGAVAAAAAGAGTASVAASQFVDSTSISVDGAATNVTALTAARSVTLSATSAANQLKYSSGADTATVVLSGYNGTITFDDNSSTTETTTLKTLNLSGTVTAATAASATNHTTAVPGVVTIADSMGAGTTVSETIATVNLALTSAANVNLDDLNEKLVTIDASASTGALTISPVATSSGNKLASIKTGSGADVVGVALNTDVNGSVGPTAAAVSTGAGNDTITVTSTGTGTVSIDAGAGDDSVVISSALLGPKLTLVGGDGTDKIKFTVASAGATMTTEESVMLAEQATGFERAEFVGLTALDASKVAFTTLDLGSNTATVTKLADTQTVNAAISATLSANGYLTTTSSGGVALGLTTTQYAGALTVNASGAYVTAGTTATQITQTVNATSLTLNVSNAKSSAATKVGDQTAADVVLTGDVKTAVINLTSGNDYVTTATSNNIISTVTLTPTDAVSNLQYTALGNLTSVTLTGVGNAVIVNSDLNSTSDGAGSKLATIDASALGGVKGALPANTAVGDPLGGLTFTGNTYLAETVTLGKGKDLINVNSTYDKMDTINGFVLVGNTDATLITAKSDDIAVSGSTSFAKVTSGLTAATIGGTLIQAADLAANQVVFQFGGNTYAYVDGGTAGTLDSSDTVIKLTGAIDLDLLVLALNS